MNANLQTAENLLANLSVIGADASGGLTRLLFSESWRQAQDELFATFEEAGLKARFDAAGNLFGRAEGCERPQEVVLTGSHIDSVRNGGTLDGQYGIVAGFLAIKRLLAAHGAPRRTLEVVAFAEEEGSRFPFAFWGSKNLVGSVEREPMREVRDADGQSFAEAMVAAGFDFEAAPTPPRRDVVAFLEAHIEQGAVLERLGKPIGIVTAIAGQKRYNVRVLGEANHAGTTPMGMRKDALEGATRAMVALFEEAKRLGDPLVLTFGRIETKPGIVNVVPGEAVFSVDTRHTDPVALDAFARVIEERLRSAAAALDLGVEIENWMDEAPVPMDAQLIGLLGEACQDLGIDAQVMHSGAGHDSQIVAPHIPTAMLFVPSVKGISHNPREDTHLEDLECGIGVLEAALFKLAY
jgi:allantoate deiminase